LPDALRTALAKSIAVGRPICYLTENRLNNIVLSFICLLSHSAL